MSGTFTKNTLITFVTRIFTVIFGIGTSVIIARILGPQGQGIYSLVILLPSILFIFTNFGISTAAIFYIGKNQYSLKEFFGSNIIFTILISIFTVLIGLVIIVFFGGKFFPGVEKEYLFLSLLLIPFSFFFDIISSILLGLQKIKKYNFISFLQGFIFLFLIGILLLGLRFGIKAAILSQIFSLAFVGIVLFFIVNKETNGMIFKLNKKHFKETFSYGFKTYLSSVFTFLHYRVDIFLINLLMNPIAVGFYYVATRVAEGVWLLSTSAGTVLFPRVASEKDEKSLKEFTPIVCRNVLFITLIMIILLFILGNWIITLFYSKDFSEAIQPFKVLLMGTLAICGWRILVNDLIGRGKPMLNTYITGASVVLNVILNILWIPRWGLTGCAWATTVSYTIAFIITIFVYSKISGNKIKNIVLFQKSDIRFYQKFLLNIKNLKI